MNRFISRITGIRHNIPITLINKSEQGKDILLINNYRYAVCRKEEHHTVWSCTYSCKGKRCSVSVWTQFGKVIKQSGEHSHKSYERTLIDTEGPQFVTSKKGGKVLYYSKYKYHNSKGSFWVCSSKKKLRCKASLTAKEGDIMKSNYEHNHPPLNKYEYVFYK